MQYTLILTETTAGGIQVSIPALPACRVEADTRDDAIRLAREAIAQLVSRSEVVQVEIPEQPRAGRKRHLGVRREPDLGDRLDARVHRHDYDMASVVRQPAQVHTRSGNWYSFSAGP
jgi:predicted RNase H-like HicB family nuclease